MEYTSNISVLSHSSSHEILHSTPLPYAPLPYAPLPHIYLMHPYLTSTLPVLTTLFSTVPHPLYPTTPIPLHPYRNRVAASDNIKSVPLKAMLAAYGHAFSVQSNYVSLQPDWMGSPQYPANAPNQQQQQHQWK